MVPKAKDPERGQLYELQGWLANAPGLPEGLTPTVTPPDNTTTFAGISEMVYAMRVNALRLLDYEEVDLIVEIFIPRKLLAGLEACNLDQLNLKLWEGLEKPLNVQYTVVFRSEERAYEPKMEGTWDIWRARWKKRPVPPLNADDSHVVCLTDFNGKPKVLLLDKLRKGGPVCLAPYLLAGERKEAETLARLDLLLVSGTPIAVWYHRPVEDVQAVMSALNTLVCGAPAARRLFRPSTNSRSVCGSCARRPGSVASKRKRRGRLRRRESPGPPLGQPVPPAERRRGAGTV